MSVGTRWLLIFTQIILVPIAIVWILIGLFHYGPAIETALFPVVEKLVIVGEREAPGGKTEIDAYFVKVRNCEYVGIAWFVHEADQVDRRVSVELLRRPEDTSSPNRPVGAQRAGPWIIDIPFGELRETSAAVLYHKCHPFWLTTTEFFP
jgi:hypothetical protein